MSKTGLNGRELGQNNVTKELSVGDVQISPICADASITVGAEASDVRAITIQLKDAAGAAINYAEEVEIVLFTTAARVAYVATGGSTGLAIGASGALQATVAKKRFNAVSTVAGVIALTWTDTGTEACFMGVKLPTGVWVMSSALTNA